ncbi:piggyBac transposable element-derived protein 4-like [Hyperolius riggenbachi]|uniref:piggyBac transposable element-derived protein 4-like n=1 Tax=Hyperolius riggenbachi TaxID=752182 RepID=UPI0035A2D41C
MASSSRRRLCDQELLDVLEGSDSEEELVEESTDSEVPGDLSSESESSDGETEEPVSVARTWCELESPTQAPPPRFPFTGAPGQKIACDHSPLSYLELFLTDEVIRKIVEETNRYAAQQQEGASLPRFSRARKWEPVTCDDIWVFLGLIILQGVVGKPLQKWYWTTNKILSTPFFGSVMSEPRFTLIMKYLHFSNNDEFDEATHPAPKLKKIWEIYQLIVANFKAVYVPDRDITVDESLMAYKGRLSWVQFIASKRARFGVKSFMLCEAKTGYIWNSVIYTGKGTKFAPQYREFGCATSSVLTLIEPLLDQGYCLTTDNFYSSPELFEHLIQHKTDAYGTVRANRRNMPSAFTARKLKKGEVVAWQKGKMMALRWRDKRDVCILSTVHNSETARTTTRSRQEVEKPKAVLDYNKTMGSVDRADGAMSFYPAVRKQQRKYYKKIFRHLLEQCLWNSYVLYKQNSDSPVPHHDFIWKLTEAICVKHPPPESAARPGRRASYVVNPTRLSGRHFAEHLPPTALKQAPTRRCVVCCNKKGKDGKKIRKETRFYCPDCDVALCIIPCFKEYHTKEVF